MSSFLTKSKPRPLSLKGTVVQTKLEIGQQDDQYEQEADRMAENVMRMPANEQPLQRKCAECGDESLEMKPFTEGIKPVVHQQPKGMEVQTKSDNANKSLSSSLEGRLISHKGQGQALPDRTQQSMSRAFGADFSGVKVHTDGEAVQMNRELGAKAFTHGPDVYFNAGEYNPSSGDGKRLLGHELTHVLQQKVNNDSIQLKEEEDEVVEDDKVYYVIKGNANIRQEKAPHSVIGKTKIPIGTKVKIIMKYGEEARKIQELDNPLGQANVWWTSKGNIEPAETVASLESYIAYFENTPVKDAPFAENTGNTLEKGKKYLITAKISTYLEVKKVDDEKPIGWVLSDFLFDRKQSSRVEKLRLYKEWLEARYKEVIGKSGEEKIKLVQGFLAQIEQVSANINQETPIYPDLNKLSIVPSFSAENNPDLNTFVPHELIEIVRKFIVLTEMSEEGAIECENPTIGGSKYTSIDWNTRLGVPQYRSQSDNAIAPEALCVATSMAMGLERLGIGRNEIVKAIDKKLAPEETDEEKIKKKWEDAFVQYFDAIESEYQSRVNAKKEAEAHNKNREEIIEKNNKSTIENKEIDAKNKTLLEGDKIPLKEIIDEPEMKKIGKTYPFRRLLGAKEGIAKNDEQEKAIARIMRESGQMEDLIDFLNWLNLSEDAKINSVDSHNNALSNSNSGTIFNQIKKANDLNDRPAYLDLKGQNKKIISLAPKIKKELDEGNTVILNYKHKGYYKSETNKKVETDGHVIVIQSITSNELIVDDPYGGANPTYRRDKESPDDAYSPTDNKTRTKEFKNQKHDSDGKIPMGKRDFTVEAGQNMTTDETLGDSHRMPFAMFDESIDIITLLVEFKRPK